MSHTISKGDPVVVVGELYTHQWETEQGKRSRPQLRAEAVGPDLARGVAEYRRTPRATTAVEPAAEPTDPYTDRPTDYEEGDATLHDVDADDLIATDELEPSLT